MTLYHVTLNGQGYVLDLDRYQKRIREPFAGKQGAGVSDLDDLRGPEQVLAISDWSGGDGHLQHEEAASGGYRSGGGVDGSSEPGALRLGPDAVSVQNTTDDGLNCMAVAFGRLYVGTAGGGIYYWDGTTWVTVFAPNGIARLCMAAFQGVLYLGSNNTTLASITAGGTVASAATVAARIWSMATHYRGAAQYLYLGVEGTGAGGIGRLYFWDGASVSLGQFDPEEVAPYAMAVMNERLFFVAADADGSRWGLYSVDNTASGANWSCHARIVGGGGISAVVVDGVLYVGCLATGRIWSWDGEAVRVVRELSGPSGAYTTPIYAMVSWRGALWVGVTDGGALSLLRYDPARQSWSRPVAGLTGTIVRSMAVYGSDLYVGTQQTGAARLYRVRAMAFGASGSLESSLIDFGLPGVSKLLRSVTISTAALVSPQSVQVEYRLEDTGAWTSLGTLSAVGATTATFSFPASTTCRQLSLRMTLSGTAGATSSPTVYQLSVRYVPRPTVTREWDLAVVLEGTAELPLVTLDGSSEPLTGAQLTTALWASAASAGSVTLVDLDGASYSVYVQDVREEMAKVSQRKGYQRLGLVKLVEAA